MCYVGVIMDRFKYCRTFHFPWSPGIASDDKVYKNPGRFFQCREGVLSVKMDGENSCLYSDGYTHARSIDSAHHVSREWLKNFWAERCYELPAGWRVYGENLYAKHSIYYENLDSYFMAFSIFDENNRRLDWDDFLMWCELIGITPVKTLGRFTPMDRDNERWDDQIQQLFKNVVRDGGEGVVYTTTEGFDYKDFSQHLIKAVRADHVTTDQHWRMAEMFINQIGTK